MWIIAVANSQMPPWSHHRTVFKGCGAFTGEMFVEQMKDMGITNVMIGHSERRGEFGIFKMDDDSTLATKLKYILDAGMTCCFALGEPLPVREQGLEKVLELMDTQLSQIYSLLDPKKVVLAYEPVWAIGTGKTATPEDAQATHQASASSSLRRHPQRLRQVFAFSMVALPMQGMLQRFQQWKTLMGSLLGVPPLSLRSKKSWMPLLQRRRSETK